MRIPEKRKAIPKVLSSTISGDKAKETAGIGLRGKRQAKRIKKKI